MLRIIYNTLETTPLRNLTRHMLEQDLVNSPEEGKKRLEIWSKYRKDIMTSILMAKVRHNPWIITVLLDTGESILASVTEDKYWGCGTTLESQLTRSMDKWLNAMNYTGAENWIPLGNSHHRNHLGKLWMKIRDHFREEKLLPTAIIIGDMIR